MVKKEAKSEKPMAEETEEDDGYETSGLYAEIKKEDKDKIDELKKLLKARDPDRKVTLATVIENAIEMYYNYYKMPKDIHKLMEKHDEGYSSRVELIIDAIRALEEIKNPDETNIDALWCRTRDELGMLLMGKTTFNQMIHAAEQEKDSLDRPIKRNIALDVITWYYKEQGKLLKHLTFREILKAIQKMWVVSNYFTRIDVSKKANDNYFISFKHSQNLRYSQYWYRYFKELFESEHFPYHCMIEGEALEESIAMDVKINGKKTIS